MYLATVTVSTKVTKHS